ncbi:MarR family transcriptional regulator [Actinomadura fulvescens]|uniref:MarR family transcriptional regulator n=1 Tax=Actinomadura fulvescens TaxID=46160 RepID=A0ABN3PGT4_9ACTN
MHDRIDGQTGYLLVKLGGSAGARFERALAPLGMKGRHVRVLEILRNDPRSQSELCQETGMDRTTMVAVIDELERLGCVRRERSLTDRRKHVVSMTERGGTALGESAVLLTQAQDELLAPLSAAERDRLHALLIRLYAQPPDPCAPLPPT